MAGVAPGRGPGPPAPPGGGSGSGQRRGRPHGPGAGGGGSGGPGPDQWAGGGPAVHLTKTASVHVSNVLRKLGLASRAAGRVGRDSRPVARWCHQLHLEAVGVLQVAHVGAARDGVAVDGQGQPPVLGRPGRGGRPGGRSDGRLKAMWFKPGRIRLYSMPGTMSGDCSSATANPLPWRKSSTVPSERSRYSPVRPAAIPTRPPPAAGRVPTGSGDEAARRGYPCRWRGTAPAAGLPAGGVEGGLHGDRVGRLAPGVGMDRRGSVPGTRGSIHRVALGLARVVAHTG